MVSVARKAYRVGAGRYYDERGELFFELLKLWLAVSQEHADFGSIY